MKNIQEDFASFSNRRFGQGSGPLESIHVPAHRDDRSKFRQGCEDFRPIRVGEAYTEKF